MAVIKSLCLLECRFRLLNCIFFSALINRANLSSLPRPPLSLTPRLLPHSRRRRRPPLHSPPYQRDGVHYDRAFIASLVIAITFHDSVWYTNFVLRLPKRLCSIRLIGKPLNSHVHPRRPPPSSTILRNRNKLLAIDL